MGQLNGFRSPDYTRDAGSNVQGVASPISI
jgi:hypothetical protein